MGWFYGFKLHIIINDRGEILNFMFTPGNVDDREPLYPESFIKNVKGKLCGDKGYIGKKLFEFLFMNGLQLVTKVKSNMKNSLMSVADKIMLAQFIFLSAQHTRSVLARRFQQVCQGRACRFHHP